MTDAPGLATAADVDGCVAGISTALHALRSVGAEGPEFAGHAIANLRAAFIKPLTDDLSPATIVRVLISLHASATNVAASPADQLVQQEVAWHEAGHGVVAHHLGLKVAFLSILADGTTSGRCIFGPSAPVRVRRLDDRSAIEAQILVELCGSLAGAEKLTSIGGQPRQDDWARHTEATVELARRVAGTDEGQIEPYLNWMLARARALLDEHWGLINIVAAALLELKTLDHEHFLAILADCAREDAASLDAAQAQQETDGVAA